MSDYYEILGLGSRRFDQRLSVQDIKHAYKRALLHYHPDKVASVPPKAKPSVSQVVTVDDVSLAYKTLADSQLRAQYDRALARSAPPQDSKPGDRVHHTGLETVDLDALAFDDESQTWSRSCRCGDVQGFVVTESELEKHVHVGELTAGCGGCSLWLRVLFSVEG